MDADFHLLPCAIDHGADTMGTGEAGGVDPIAVGTEAGVSPVDAARRSVSMLVFADHD